MKKDDANVLLREIGEKFGNDIARLISPLRVCSVTVMSTDEDFAYVTMHNDAEPMPVSLNVYGGMAKMWPNVGSLSLIGFVDGNDDQPFFIYHSLTDRVSMQRGVTTIDWSFTPPARDDEGDEGEVDEDNATDEVLIKVGETSFMMNKETINVETEKTSVTLTPEQIDVVADNSTVTLKKDLIEMNGGSLDALVVIGKLTERLNKLQSEIDTLQANITSHTHTYIDSVGAAGTPTPKTTTATTYTKANISTFSDSEYENTKITQ